MSRGGNVAATLGRRRKMVAKSVVPTRDVIAAAAAGIGGAERLINWIQADVKNEATFWSSIYPKLISVQLSGETPAPTVHHLIVKFVD